MSLSAGERRHRIRFERAVEVENDFGEIVSSGYQPVAEVGANGEVWAKRTNQLSATAEAVASGATTYREQVRWDILARAIDPAWRLVEVRTGKVFDIKSVGTSNDGRETAVIALAGLNGG